LGVESSANVKPLDLLRELDYMLKLDSRIKDAFHTVRKQGSEGLSAW
jgi:hypothetical protein